ncbi:MAG: hypothetical protein H6R10_2095 [Rhodocyclaceae bacterium]|nr:hypothetical protein [Rhodocyclaceae bacterium]
MKTPCQPLAALSFLVIAGLLAGAAQAADMPKRKSGLWEMKTQMAGMPSAGAMQMCVDQNTDNLMQEQARGEKPNCSAMDVNRSGGKMAIHSVCKHEGITVTTDAVITGDFESGYKSDMKMRYSPPQHGMSEMQMTQEAKWLGPCKPGQKPGDMMMSGMPGGKVNVHEMMKRQ